MKKVRVLTAEEAALLVKDGDTIATGGFVSCACPEALSKALEKRFLETGHPKDLTLFFAAGQGHRDGTGGDHYGHEGMVKRVIGGHWDRAPKLGDLALANKIEAYNLPQGVISHMYRDIAAHNIGTITTVGLYTFADPRNGGGKLNDCTTEDLVKVINIEGKELLLYKGFPINVVFLRASYADEYGNCTVHREIGPIDVLFNGALGIINRLKEENRLLKEERRQQQERLKTYAEEYCRMGNECITLAHDSKAALANYDKALDLCPTLVEAWIRKGVTLHDEKNYHDAAHCFNEAVRLSPRLFKAVFNRGKNRLILGDIEGAASDLDRATTLKPEHIRAHELYGDALSRAGKTDEAALQWAIAEELREKKRK